MAEAQVGAGQKLWTSDYHYILREVASRNVRKFNTTATDYLLSLNPQSEEEPLLDQLGNIFDSLVHEMTSGMADIDLVRFVLQSRSLQYPISLPFMPRHELNAERILGEVQRFLQSNEQVNLVWYASTCGSCGYATRGSGLAQEETLWIQIVQVHRQQTLCPAHQK